MGRPKILIDDTKLRQIQIMSGYGIGQGKMAAILGISQGTMKTWKKTKEVSTAFEKGSASAEVSVSKSLFDQAVRGVLPAIVWFEKTRCGRSERNLQQEVDAQLEIELTHILNTAKGILEAEIYNEFLQALASSNKRRV